MINHISEKICKLKYLVHNLTKSFLGKLNRNGIKAFWYRDNIVTNFGDLITPFLLKSYGYTAIRSDLKNARLVSTGSILQGIPEDFPGIILGTGFIKEHIRTYKYAKVLAIRGELSKKCLNLDHKVPLGDPGLLLPLFVSKKEKKIEIGIIPHYTDLGSPKLYHLLQYFGNTCKLIDVRRHPEKVAKEISSCHLVISSSLHGLIVAHAYSVKAIWMILENGVIGDGFKFRDYASSLEIDLKPFNYSIGESLANIEDYAVLPNQSSVLERTNDLERLFKKVLPTIAFP